MMTESHPLQPFLPSGAKILMLGSFPPKRERWSMDFFYPNFNNDMWRIMGLVFFGDRTHFIVSGSRRFDRDAVVSFCSDKGIALYDTASEVRRLKDNASDKFLEIVTPTDISALLESLPECRAVATTGQKAAETAAAVFGCPLPSPGTNVLFRHPDNTMRESCRLWRMPSSSRAYPMKLEQKAVCYRDMMIQTGLLRETE